MITEEIRKQWNLPNNDFKNKVKCCYNCPNWQRDIGLRGEYAYNYCRLKKDTMTAWDGVCDKYCGDAKEENLLKDLTKEEREILDEVDND